MMLRAPCLCLMVLISISFTTTSSQEIVCYIREALIKDGDGGHTTKINHFWGYLPSDMCTRYIFVVENFRRRNLNGYLSTFRNRKPPAELGMLVSRYTKYHISRYAFYWVKRFNFDGMHFIWDYRYGNPYTARERKQLIATARSKFPSKTVSQAIECKPRFREHVDFDNNVNEVDLTVVLVKIFIDEVPSFIETTKACSLSDLNIPHEKAVIGLRELTGDLGRNLAKFRPNCHDAQKRNMLRRISIALSCLVHSDGFQGVMVWSIQTDDYVGNVCNKGKYPFIATYKEYLKSCSKPEFASGAMMIKPVVFARESHVVVWALLSHVLHALFYL